MRCLQDRAVLLLCGMLFAGCVFFPDEPEPPVQPSRFLEDPLNFGDILYGNKEKFNIRDYVDLFHENLVYRDPGSQEFGRQDIVTRLKDIVTRYTGESGDVGVVIEWSRADEAALDPEPFDKKNEVELQPRKYRAFLVDSVVTHGTPDSVDTTFEFDYGGEATFHLLFDTLSQEWAISYWFDSPADGAACSFFHPLFAQPD